MKAISVEMASRGTAGAGLFLSTLLAAMASGCVENNLSGKPDEPEAFDTGTAFSPDTAVEDTALPPEECDGLDNDGDGEIDEGFPDDDHNGRVDCQDEECPVLYPPAGGPVDIVAECTGTIPTVVDDPWDATIEWQYRSSGSGVIVMPAVGNLTDDNGDGRVDENDDPDIAFTTWTSNTLVALDSDGTEIFEINGFDGQGGPVIADVDGDGQPEVVAIRTGGSIAAVDATGTIEWTSATFGMMAYPQVTVADLDEDGMPEVVGDVGVVNGEDGSTVATLSGITNSWRTPVAADIDQDGEQEIILGNRVFDSNGTLKWTNPGTGSGNFAAVADIDGDEGGEVFFVSGSTGYIHDDDGTLLSTFVIPGTNPGPPCVADFDGDGEVEIAAPANTLVSVFDIDGTKLWSMPINDTSGLAGCSGYDVDGDGAYEVLYADQDSFDIYDGATGTVNYTNSNHASGTVWEYPVTADVDNDGSAEIVVADNGGAWQGVTVYGHAGDGWPKSGTTWATHDFAVTNIEPDGSVPREPEPSWQVYNVFRARPSVDDPSSADLVPTFDDACIADCDYGPVKIVVGAYNQGGADVEAGTVLQIWADDDTGPRLVTSISLPTLPAGTRIDSFEVPLTPADIGAAGWYAIIDPGDDVRECNEDNNRAEWRDTPCF